MQDASYNVMGIVDATGVLVERYEYTPYGQRTTYISAGANDPGCYLGTLRSQRVQVADGSGGTVPLAWGLCDIGHQGLMHDEELGGQTALIYNRARMLHPTLGRFMQRDPLGYVDGMSTYAGYHVMHEGVDPSGEAEEAAKYPFTFHASAEMWVRVGGVILPGRPTEFPMAQVDWTLNFGCAANKDSTAARPVWGPDSAKVEVKMLDEMEEWANVAKKFADALSFVRDGYTYEVIDRNISVSYPARTDCIRVDIRAVGVSKRNQAFEVPWAKLAFEKTPMAVKALRTYNSVSISNTQIESVSIIGVTFQVCCACDSATKDTDYSVSVGHSEVNEHEDGRKTITTAMSPFGVVPFVLHSGQTNPRRGVETRGLRAKLGGMNEPKRWVDFYDDKRALTPELKANQTDPMTILDYQDE